MKQLPKVDLKGIADYYQANSMDFRSATFLITGGSGFVGSWLTEALLNLNQEFELGLKVTCLVRDITKAQQLFANHSSYNLRFIEADVARLTNLPNSYSHIIHAATPTTKISRGGDLENIHSSSALGAKNILSLIGNGPTRPVFLHTSSGAVYGTQPMGLARLAISTPIRATSFSDSVADRYAQSKIETENYVNNADSQGKVVGINARLFAFMGPRLPLDQHFAIGNFISSAISDNVVKIKGDGKSVRSYLYAAEMTCHLLFLLSARISGSFHIGSDIGFELSKWAQMVADVCGAEVRFLNEDRSSPTRYVPERDFRIPQLKHSQDRNLDNLGRWRDWIVQSKLS